jgi:7-cyano-7-deazaguanine synthase
MIDQSPQPDVALLYSGGLDSSILLLQLLAEGRRVQPLYVMSGLIWEEGELLAARRFLLAAACPALAELVTIQMPLADLYGGHWSVTGRGVPNAQSPDEAVYLPGRNPLLAVKARVWCQLQGIAQLAIGCLETSPFADASPEFFTQFESMMDSAVGGRVRIVRPLADKRQGMRWGRSAPLELTLSCLAPRGTLHCGECNKCAERRLAFAEAGLADPTWYAVHAGAVRPGNPRIETAAG